MNEPYRIRVMRGCRIFRILLACFTALFVQMQVLPVYASDSPLEQQRTIRGTVTDETGAPFPFVTVMLMVILQSVVLQTTKGSIV